MKAAAAKEIMAERCASIRVAAWHAYVADETGVPTDVKYAVRPADVPFAAPHLV